MSFLSVQSQSSLSPDIVWKPIPNTSQEIAVDTRADHTLYYGTRGPGKTATQLMHFRQYVGVGYGAFMKGMIIDKEYKNFVDVIAQSKRFFLPFGDCRFYSSTTQVKWVWDTGEELYLRHMKKNEDYDDVHGWEITIMMFNELTKQPTSDLYENLMSINRSSFIPEIHTPKNEDGSYNTHNGKPLPPIPLKFFSTCNPYGSGRLWVKKRFIDVAKVGSLYKKTYRVFDPKTQKEEDTVISQIAIFGSFKENIYLDKKYIASLYEMTKNNPNKRKAWIEGSWDANGGGAFDDIWNSDIHIIDRFKIPPNWHTKRCFDWGSSSPFAVVWIAEANGEEVVMENGDVFCPQRGSLIVFHEWYGGEDISNNKGLKLSPREVAEGIIEREESLILRDWIKSRPYPGAADNQIGKTDSVDVETMKKRMSDAGIDWNDSDKSSGSRVNGLQLIRNALKCSVDNEGEGLYFMRHCEACLQTIPYLPLDDDNPEDLDTDSNDHLYDALRYGVLESMNRTVSHPDVRFFT